MGLIFDGIDLKTNYNFVVTNINGRGSPPVSRTMLELPRIDGAIELNSKLQSRNITIRGYVYGTDASTKKDALVKLITQAYSREKKLTFPDTNRSIYVKLAGEPIVLGPVGPVLNAQAYELTFNFVAQDPYFYGEDHDESGFRIVKVNANAPTYLISPRRKFLKREAAFKIEPYTIVNLLGKYGDFETDSNDDGRADGWALTSGITCEFETGLFGSRAQVIKTTSSSSKLLYLTTTAFQQNGDYRFPAGSTLFFTGYTRKVSSMLEHGIIEIKAYNYNQSKWIWFSVDFPAVNAANIRDFPDNNWYQGRSIIKITDSEFKVELKLIIHSDDINEAAISVDGFAVYNLTAMGALPYGLQQYFGLQLWEDLATTSNIEALDERVQTGEDWLAELLPFCNGIKTLGFAWEGI